MEVSQNLIQAISSVGFPIVMCLLLYFDFRKVMIKKLDRIIELLIQNNKKK